MPEKYPESDFDASKPSQDGTRRFWNDQLLRSKGWSIYARANGCPAMWTDGKKILTEEQALRILGL